jgi:hypothetical protein
MKRIATSVVTLAVACLGMSSNASAANPNDRFYVAGFSPSVTTPLTTTSFHLTVTNDRKSGPTHPIRQVQFTVPAGFTLVPLSGGGPAVTVPPHWVIFSVVGQQYTVITTGAYELTSGKSVEILVNARSPSAAANCAPQAYTWALAVSQSADGGTGNDFKLRQGSPVPSVSVAATSCVTLTNMVLNSVSPNAISSTNTSVVVTLTATLTRADTHAPIPAEPIRFEVGAEPVTCQVSPITNSSGVATCSYTPQNPLSSALAAPYNYDSFAFFDGDTAPNPDLGASSDGPIQLAVNATGTGLAAADASGLFGATVDLQATLTSGANTTPVAGKTVTFLLNGFSVGTAVTNDSGVASLAGVSVAGVNAGDHPGYIEADFAGDTTYSLATGTSQLTVNQVSTAITLSNLSQTYTGSSLAPTVTTAAASYSLTGAPQTNAGSYPVTANITDPNYSNGSATGTFIIAPAALTASITASDKVYDGTKTATITSCTLTGVAAVDAGKVACSASGTFAFSNVGTWTVTATSVILSGSVAANYQVSALPTTIANITPKTASVTPNTATKVYEGAEPVLTGTLTGFLAADGVTATYSRAVGDPVGDYVISATLAPADVLTNYSITYNTAVFTITKASQAITFTAFTVTGTAPGGTVTFSSGTPSICSVNSLGAVLMLNPGTCTVTANQAGDANHLPVTRNTTLIQQ